MRQHSPRSSAATRERSHRSAVEPPRDAERLLAGLDAKGSAVALGDHLGRWGSLPPWSGSSFLDELDRSGLRGRGGAWFPVGTKWRAVRRAGSRNPVVVANGAEGEPASGKDWVLITQLPHLVLDGAVIAAISIGASQVVMHVPSGAVPAMTRALEERKRRNLDRCTIDIVVSADRFLAGQETAVVSTIVGRTPAMPTFVGLRSIREQGVGGRPTLVQNVESLAHAALIARFGAEWFRQIGSPESPGTALLTVTGRWAEPRIVEAPLGMPLGESLLLDASNARSIQGVLLGGYGGGWLSSAEALAMPLTEETARLKGSSIGSGVVALLPSGICSLSEVSRVVRYLEGQGAGQCGPCVNGLAALANSLELLAHRPASLRGGLPIISRLCGLVEGRGACHHPDGAARFVRSALRVFADHAAVHLQRGPCPPSAPFLPTPPSESSPVRSASPR